MLTISLLANKVYHAKFIPHLFIFLERREKQKKRHQVGLRSLQFFYSFQKEVDRVLRTLGMVGNHLHLDYFLWINLFWKCCGILAAFNSLPVSKYLYDYIVNELSSVMLLRVLDLSLYITNYNCLIFEETKYQRKILLQFLPIAVLDLHLRT